MTEIGINEVSPESEGKDTKTREDQDHEMSAEDNKKLLFIMTKENAEKKDEAGHLLKFHTVGHQRTPSWGANQPGQAKMPVESCERSSSYKCGSQKSTKCAYVAVWKPLWRK